MTKRRANGHKKTSRPRQRRWLQQIGGGAVALVALAIVVLAVVGMTKGGGSENTARSEITPVVESESTQTAPRTGGPALAFDVTSVDFGNVPLNTNVSYAFPFSNTGDATLQIEDVQVKTLEGC